jgi:hypothetical protein
MRLARQARLLGTNGALRKGLGSAIFWADSEPLDMRIFLRLCSRRYGTAAGQRYVVIMLVKQVWAAAEAVSLGEEKTSHSMSSRAPNC